MHDGARGADPLEQRAKGVKSGARQTVREGGARRHREAERSSRNIITVQSRT